MNRVSSRDITTEGSLSHVKIFAGNVVKAEIHLLMHPQNEITALNETDLFKREKEFQRGYFFQSSCSFAA